MADEQFHEFHLDGKQMVFLFMASTVVAVVIFLCGVMVGRGVRANKNADTVAATASELVDQIAAVQTDALETGVPTTTTTAPRAADSPNNGNATEAAPPVSEQPREADGRGPVVETATTPTPTRAPVPASQEPPRAAAKESPAAGVPLALREPAGPGFAVQVMAVPRLNDAEAAARKLSAKGYRPFVLPTGEGKTVYRVRVGKFKTRKDADAARTRLEKVEKYRKPWVAAR